MYLLFVRHNDMQQAVFGSKVKALLKVSGYSQKGLAEALGRNPSVLTHKLNGTGRTILTRKEVRQIIKQLIWLGVITQKKEVLDLLETAGCPDFKLEEWAAAPLNQL